MKSNAIILYASMATSVFASSVNLTVNPSVPSSASLPVPLDFQSFSIEFAFFADFSGNKSHPNKFSNNLLANLRKFNGDVPQILRIGGNTQDHVTYYPNQKESIINNWAGNGGDQPANTSIGPTFWESFTSIDGPKYIFGLNFYKNDSYYLDNLKGEVQQSLEQIPAERLHLFEIGNENDYGALSGFRPPNWTQEDWVTEWNNRAEHIQTANQSLRFFAPSTCCYNITTKWSFFSPWTIWNSTFNYNRHKWIHEVSQHGYISGTGNHPTLQGTLMNHTSVVKNGTIHQSLNALNTAGGRYYTLGETNSISGQGAWGVSNVFGAALFIVDYELYYASFGVRRMHMHQGTAYRYGAWMPISQNGVGPSTNPPYYGHTMVSKFIGNSTKTQINNIDLKSDFHSAYAAYEDGELARVVLLNLQEWNPSGGVNATNATDPSVQALRPNTTFTLDSVIGYSYATVELLTAPGALSTKNITMAGVSYDYELAEGKPVKVGNEVAEVIRPQKNGTFSVSVGASTGALLKFYKA
ncbi:glycoside hydrolase family 79 protein [Talaromyces proteolyticus]|uniref:Glycoside hydrolase family 79 protein n=1 Tax=Talaromyces proteolyticus TaxID=1131652 RepID=A0AAD4L217_9EURO|nr:glycoside hydrolase family 79 protein [Talaromyces proteolyticus]KAH8705719.1 glycoside hydrolase family 79 protein [Talaromyces proteolyticus]